jgi:transcriptional regulator with XRE-family HTH domain
VPEPADPSLAERLRGLRTPAGGVRVTQQQLAAVFGVSTGLISSWESGGAVPSTDWLRRYALAFATERTFAGREPRLLDENDLSASEERARQALIDELGELREQAQRPGGARSPGRGALGGRFWYYPDGAPVRVITTPVWPSLEKQLVYADPWHPNFIQSFRDMDRDATIEVVSHIRAENPATDVRFMTADNATRDDLIKHVVVLGQLGSMALEGVGTRHQDSEYETSVMDYLIRRQEFPVAMRVPPDGDNEFDAEFVVTLDGDGRARWFGDGEEPDRLAVYRPRFLRHGREREEQHGYPVLEYDAALIARRPNELNRAMSVTLCTGVFSRGTFGAVRAFTDPTLRARNEQFLRAHFKDPDDFWMLFYVPVFRAMHGLETVTPDLARPFHRLHDSQGDD